MAEDELREQIRVLRVSLALTPEGRLPPALYLTPVQLAALPPEARTVAPKARAVESRLRLVSRPEAESEGGDAVDDGDDDGEAVVVAAPLQRSVATPETSHPLSFALKELLSESLGSLDMVSHVLALESPGWWVETTPTRAKTNGTAASASVQPQQGWVEKQLAEGRPMVNFVGQTDALGPVTVSAVQEDVQGRRMVVALIRSAGGDQLVRVDAQVLKSKRRSMRVKGADAAMMLEAVSPVLSNTASIRRVPKARESEMSQALLQHELEGKQTQYKFGVVRQARGQSSQDAILGNECSPAFDRFLALLGDKIELLGHKGFKGTHSVYARRGAVEVMYHVAPLLPGNEGKEQQLGRKRHVGNDVVIIVFQEGDCDVAYQPGCITSNFIHAAIIVRPAGTGYRVAVQARRGVGQFAPPLPPLGVFAADDAFVQWMFEKCIMAEQAAMESPSFAPLLKVVKERQLKELTKKFSGHVENNGSSGTSSSSPMRKSQHNSN